MKKIYTSVISLALCLSLSTTTLSAENINVDVPEGWEYWGKARFTDDMVSSFVLLGPISYDVEVIRKADNPKYIRVLAPYGQAYADSFLETNGIPLNETQYNVDGTKYFELDLSDPNDVKLPAFCYTGCSWGYGELYWGLLTGVSFTLDNNTVTAPVNSMGIIDDSGFYYANQNGGFALVLPSSDGITDITADENTQAVYYDLQGRKTDNPTHGIFICRQGSKTSKVYIKNK